MKIFGVLFIIITFILFYSSCENKVVQPVPKVIPATCDTINVTYTKTMQLIINTNCAINSSCHGTGTANANYDNYADLQSYATGGQRSTMYYYLFTIKTMPKTPQLPLSPCQMSQFKAWLMSGAPE